VVASEVGEGPDPGRRRGPGRWGRSSAAIAAALAAKQQTKQQTSTETDTISKSEMKKRESTNNHTPRHAATMKEIKESNTACGEGE